MSDAQRLQWNADALWQRLAPLLPGLSVEVLARTDSTNTRLLERWRASGALPEGRATRPGELDGLPARRGDLAGRRAADVQPCLLVAEQQTQGRGRLGRQWLSGAGASLTFSLSLPFAPPDWSGLSLAVGLALAEALDPGDEKTRILLKWPNDLWLVDRPGSGRKLGGILIETASVGSQRLCVVGVGLNVLPLPAAGLANGYACLQELQADISAPAALACVAEPLVRELLRFEAEGFAPRAIAYARRDLLRGQPVHTSLQAVPRGVAEGVDGSGALLVRDGELHRVTSGEVSVGLGAGPV